MYLKRIIYFVCGILCAVSVSGCVITKVHTVPVEDFNMPYESAWDSILTYLNKDKEPIIVSDKEKGFVSTDWVIIEKVFSAKRYRYDIQVNKLTENEVRVGISSPQEEYSMGDWEPMLPAERRANRIFKFIRNWKGITEDGKPAVKVSSGVAKRPFNKRPH